MFSVYEWKSLLFDTLICSFTYFDGFEIKNELVYISETKTNKCIKLYFISLLINYKIIKQNIIKSIKTYLF